MEKLLDSWQCGALWRFTMPSENQCRICGGLRTETQRLYECKGWHIIRSGMENEVMRFEKVALDES